MQSRDRIHEVCDQQGRRYSWLARELGITHSHLCHILAGSRGTPSWFYPRVARVLGVPEWAIRPPEHAPLDGQKEVDEGKLSASVA